MERTAVIHTRIGPLTLVERDGRLAAIRLRAGPDGPGPAGGVLGEAGRQIEEYLAGDRRSFDLPLADPADATAFQRRVWAALGRIPYGEVRTYGDLAAVLNTGARAVGGACRRNPLPLVVPCHRVVARAGLGGFSGDWETGLVRGVKAVLLALEGAPAAPPPGSGGPSPGRPAG